VKSAGVVVGRVRSGDFPSARRHGHGCTLSVP
jgi:hypothetical protein